MTFPIFESAPAPALIDDRPGVATVVAPAADTGLIRLFGLDRLPSRQRLACYWRRQPDGRLAAIWEPDIAPDPQR